ncbi:hypothetical protein QQF64_009291 [Cirrhinus molitorella]|uniref:Uncharacterized protein n=1 Tax=Cirrhinus molitorella TaxID=172907 RepID=A0ABR3M3T8_9TELE
MGEEIKEQDSTVWVRPDLTVGVKGSCRAAHIQAKVLEAFNLSANRYGQRRANIYLTDGSIKRGLRQSFPLAER